MSILTPEQIRELLERCTWTPLWQNERMVLAEKGRGYSEDSRISQIQAALSIMLEASTTRRGQVESILRGRP